MLSHVGSLIGQPLDWRAAHKKRRNQCGTFNMQPTVLMPVLLQNNVTSLTLILRNGRAAHR